MKKNSIKKHDMIMILPFIYVQGSGWCIFVWSPKREDIAADNKLWVFVEPVGINLLFLGGLFLISMENRIGIFANMYDLKKKG